MPGEHAFQISPAQAVYEANQVLSGGHRPQAQSNVWKTVACATENLQSRRVHCLGGIDSDALRIQIEEPHGGRDGVCSIRV